MDGARHTRARRPSRASNIVGNYARGVLFSLFILLVYDSKEEGFDNALIYDPGNLTSDHLIWFAFIQTAEN